MVSTQKDNSVFFSGRVVAKQGILTIHSDELTVYYAADDTGGKDVKAKESKEIKRMFAKGNVKIVQKDWVATGDTAEYFDAERKVVIVGHTKVWQDNNMVTGDRFVLFLDEGKSIVEHDQKKGERVKAFFYPDNKK
jgi:lipopolysaccharide export system protein LptA